MNPPEVVVFDLGKVLVDFDYGIAARKISARGGKSPKEVKECIDHSALLFQYETGQMSTREFYEEICRETGFQGGMEEFGRIFADIFTPIEPMVALHEMLRRRQVPTFIFSNTNELAVGHIRRSFPFFSHFDGYVLSYEHGAMKPQPKLYQVVEKTTGRKRDAILYVDDRPENIAAAQKRGWRVILQESPDKTRAAVVASGLLR